MFIFEILGLIIAFLEVKFPVASETLEELIDRTEDNIFELGKRLSESFIFTQVLFTIFSLFVLIQGTGTLLGYFDPPIYLWVLFTLFTAPVALALFVLLLAEYIHFLNKFCNGQAITGLGLSISFFSLAFNLFQVIINKIFLLIRF